MTNKDYRIWIALLFFWLIYFLAAGCATTGKTDEPSPSDVESDPSALLPSGKFEGSYDKPDVDKLKSVSDERSLKSEKTSLSDPKGNQLTDTWEPSNAFPAPGKGKIDPSSSAAVEPPRDPSVFPQPPPSDEESDQSGSPPLKKQVESGALSELRNSPEAESPSHQEDDSNPNHPAFPLGHDIEKGTDTETADSSPSSPSLVKPSNPSDPHAPQKSPGLDLPRSEAENPGISSLRDSAVELGSGSKKANSTEVSTARSLPVSISPELNKPVSGESEHPPSFTDDVRRSLESPNASLSKSVGIADSLSIPYLPPQSSSARVEFMSDPNLPYQDSADGFKVSFSQEEEAVGSPSGAEASPSIRFLDRGRVNGKHPETDKGKILGFSDGRKNSGLLERRVESSAKNFFPSSGSPNDYNSLRNFLSTRNELDNGAIGSVPSTGNYEEAKKFLEAIDLSESGAPSDLDKDGSSPDDIRYQNALEWLRSRGQGDELQN